MAGPHLYIAIPVINELAYLPATLESIAKQSFKGSFSVIICVNQPEEWWQDPEKVAVCENNQQLIQFLKQYSGFRITILDYSSPGKGWIGKKHGVGWARKVLFDHIMQIADDQDIVISLDADTQFKEHYFQSIYERFTQEGVHALSVPYYHPLGEDERANRAILRYEIYMRNYLLNLFDIDSPYSFTAVGSAIAVLVGSLRKIGGITPMKSGEDFYLLQKLQKMAPISNWNSESVYPASRFSSRVYFGTGPAMIKGDQGDWSSYPIYPQKLFEEVAFCYRALPQLWERDIVSPLISFLQKQYKTEDLWGPLRKNSKNLDQFKRAFHEKVDGLRILQFLKLQFAEIGGDETHYLRQNMRYLFGDEAHFMDQIECHLDEMSVEQLAQIRDFMYKKELKIRFIKK